MQSIYLKDFDEIFRSKGYFYNKTPFNFVKYAMRSFENYISVVIVYDNRFNDVEGKKNLDYVKNIISRDITVPAGFRIHFLSVVLNRYKDKDIKGKNIVTINTTNGSCSHFIIDIELKKELKIIEEIVEVQSVYNENWINRFGGLFQFPKKVRVTYFIMAICIVMYLFKVDCEQFCRSSNLMKTKEYYRLFTYMFLHANIIHLIGNLFGIYIIGHLLEAKIGGFKTLIIFVLSGIYGGIVSMVFNPELSSVGASGAICGLLGALLISTFTYPVWQKKEAAFKVLCYIFLVIVSGLFIPTTDNWCHIGGLMGGIIYNTIFTLCDQIEKNINITNNQKKYKEYFYKNR